MIEFIFLLSAFGTFHETAKRRGVKGWPFIAVGFSGWLLLSILSPLVVGAGPHIFLAWGWIGLTYVSIFLIGGGGRRMKASWQCPECRCYNSASTLVCLCGYNPAGVEKAAP